MAHFESIYLNQLKQPNEKLIQEQFVMDRSEDPKLLQKLSIVNLFVGPNNSGKSRFLRALFYNEAFEGTLELCDIKRLHTMIMSSERNINLKLKSYHHNIDHSKLGRAIDELISEASELKGRAEYNRVGRGNFAFIEKLITSLENWVGNRRQIEDIIRRNGVVRDSRFFTPCIEAICDELGSLLERLKKARSGMPNYSDCAQKNIYIPILRGMRCSQNDPSHFIETTFNDYFNSKKENGPVEHRLGPLREIFNGTDIYNRLASGLLDSSVTRRKVLEYEHFLSENFFNGKTVQISPRSNDQVVHIKIDPDIDLPIYALGDGMQSVLMMTFPAFFEEKPCMIFAEEPEIYLHPGLQRRLIEVIIQNKKLNRHQWFFTTHSNHLLDLTLDYSKMSVFRFLKKNEVCEITQMTSPDHNLLVDLGAMGSSIFRTNAIIWVEGITDRRYIREILRSYISRNNLPSFREDIHYSFVEFSGGNIVHFEFSGSEDPEKIKVERVVSNSFLVLDGDNIKKASRIEDLREALKERLFVFEEKEIENILPESIVRNYAKKTISGSTQFDDSTKEALLPLTSKIKMIEYSKPDKAIGTYLDNIFGIKNYKNDKGEPRTLFKEKSGTIKNKVKFCDFVVGQMSGNDDWEMSQSVQALAKKIYSFIKEAN